MRKVLLLLLICILITACNKKDLPINNLNGNVITFAISPDNNYAVFLTTKSVNIFTFSTSTIKTIVVNDFYGVQSAYPYIDWSPDNNYLAISQYKTGLLVWNTENWKIITKKNWNDDRKYSWEDPGFAWSPDGDELVLGIGSGKLAIWNIASNSWKEVNGFNGDQIGLFWKKKGEIWIVSQIPKRGIYDFNTGSLIKEVPINVDGAAGPVYWSKGGRYFTLKFDLGFGLYDAEKGEGISFGVCCYQSIAWSHDGRYLAESPYKGEEIEIIDTQTAEVRKSKITGIQITWIDWNSNNELIAFGQVMNKLALWKVDTGEILYEFNTK
jgi:WD40 repeat protein